LGPRENREKGELSQREKGRKREEGVGRLPRLEKKRKKEISF
jgi:hypothetical protein